MIKTNTTASVQLKVGVMLMLKKDLYIKYYEFVPVNGVTIS